MKVLSIAGMDKKNAGPKAPSDINYILSDEYNANCEAIIKSGNFKARTILKFINNCLFNKDILVIQAPFFEKAEILYNLLPKNKSIVLIHDINGLRAYNSKLLKREMKIFNKFDYIIVHNQSMKKLLVSYGINEKKIYVLEIFDYLTNSSEILSRKNDKNKLTLVYSGNLKKIKSPFLYQLEETKIKYKINLYGLGINKDINSKLIYKGSFEPNDIDSIEGDLGLVWDGNFDESDENIDSEVKNLNNNIDIFSYKNYTKYNNPHKLSCYLALGIPVIVWKKAAIADFVTKNNVGYTISNLYDINNIDFSDYEEKKKNAIKIGNRLRKGYYTKKVFSEIVNQINEKDKH